MKTLPRHWILASLLGCLGWVTIVGTSSCRRERKLGPPQAVVVAQDGVLRLRVMTFNVRYENPSDTGPRAWQERVVGVVRMVREERLDVFGVQEAEHGQVADLWASLPDYDFVGKGREDGRRRGEYTGLFYRRDRFEATPEQGGVFWLSDVPDRPGSMTWGNQHPRMVVWQRLVDRASGMSFTCYNTHWDHRHQGSRRKSAELMRSHMERRASEPLVVLGDFNAIAGNEAINTLVGGGATALLKSTYDPERSAEEGETTLHFWSGSRAGRLRVDHILVSPWAKVMAMAIRDGDRPLISDHFPVVAEVEFPARR